MHAMDLSRELCGPSGSWGSTAGAPSLGHACTARSSREMLERQQRHTLRRLCLSSLIFLLLPLGICRAAGAADCVEGKGRPANFWWIGAAEGGMLLSGT